MITSSDNTKTVLRVRQWTPQPPAWELQPSNSAEDHYKKSWMIAIYIITGLLGTGFIVVLVCISYFAYKKQKRGESLFTCCKKKKTAHDVEMGILKQDSAASLGAGRHYPAGPSTTRNNSLEHSPISGIKKPVPHEQETGNWPRTTRPFRTASSSNEESFETLFPYGARSP